MHLWNKFGVIGGWYYYDIYRNEDRPPSTELQGQVNGKTISLQATCTLCDSLPNEQKEEFVGVLLDDSVIAGTWRQLGGKRQNLRFRLVAEIDSDQAENPPIDTSDLKLYNAKESLNAGFFQQSFVREGLSQALGKDLPSFITFLQGPATWSYLSIEDGFLSTDFWYEHNDPAGHVIITADIATKAFYVFWSNPSDERDIHVFGRNIPRKVLDYFVKTMNSYVSYHYAVQGQTIVMDRNDLR
jgi:hypothetical protein